MESNKILSAVENGVCDSIRLYLYLYMVIYTAKWKKLQDTVLSLSGRMYEGKSKIIRTFAITHL